MAVLRYAGIGARATPAAVLADMTVMAGWLARTGWNLASGGADGADSAFAAGAPAEQRTIWLPWRGYNGHRGPDCRVLSQAALAACMEIAAPLHPAWERCSPAVRKLHARNVAILLGERLDRPVDAVVCWSERGAAVGGTGMGIRIAQSRGIPVFNLGAMAPRAVCERLRDIRRAPGSVSGAGSAVWSEGEHVPGECPAASEGVSPVRSPGRAPAQGDCAMFLSSFDFNAPAAGDMLAEIGIRPAAVRETIAEDRALRCPDRDAVFPERRIADLYPVPAHSPAARRWRRA